MNVNAYNLQNNPLRDVMDGFVHNKTSQSSKEPIDWKPKNNLTWDAPKKVNCYYLFSYFDLRIQKNHGQSGGGGVGRWWHFLQWITSTF